MASFQAYPSLAPAVGVGREGEPDRCKEEKKRKHWGLGELFSFEPLFYSHILP